MRSLFSMMALLGLSVALFSFGAARAEDEKDKDKEEGKTGKVTPDYDAALAVAGAFELMSLGKEQESPELLVAAATALAKIRLKKAKDAKEAKIEKAEDADLLKEAASALKLAKRFAKKDNEIQQDLIKAAEKQVAHEINLEKGGKRGALRGPQVRFGVVSNYDRFDTYYINFQGGEQGVVWVHNRSGRGDIDLTVIGPKGRHVVDKRPNASANVSFYVPVTGTYEIRVRKYGKGGGPLSYRLTTN